MSNETFKKENEGSSRLWLVPAGLKPDMSASEDFWRRQNERTHIRKKVNNDFPPKWSTGLIMLWSNEAGPPDFSCRDCDYIMNGRLSQTKSVNDQRCVALCRAFFQFWKHFVIRSRTTWWSFLLFMSAGLDLSVFCVIYFIYFICCTSFVFLSAVLSFSGTHFL